MSTEDIPAFPRSGFDGGEDVQSSHRSTPQNGMSLRDYFAAHAPIQIPCGFPSGPTIEATPQGSQADTTPWISWTDAERLVKWRWSYADAMLKEREKATP